MRRFFLIGLPGTNSKENAQMLAKEFQLTPILVGDLLRKEVVKKTDRGQKIDQSFKNHKLGKYLTLTIYNGLFDEALYL